MKDKKRWVVLIGLVAVAAILVSFIGGGGGSQSQTEDVLTETTVETTESTEETVSEESTEEVLVENMELFPKDATELPNLTEVELDAVAEYLGEKGIMLDISYSYDNTILDGIVVAQETTAGTPMDGLQEVKIVVNINENEIEGKVEPKEGKEIPNLIYLPIDEALVKLSLAGFGCEVECSTRDEEYEYLADNGCVLSYTINGAEENPEAELPTIAEEGDTITVYIYSPTTERNLNSPD